MSARRFTPLIAAAFVAVPVATAVRAQSAAADACARLPSPADEIACLRGALNRSEAALARTHPKAAKGHKAPPSEARREPAAPAPDTARPAEQMGIEQVAAVRHAAAAPKQPAERVHAVVETAETDPRGMLTLRLDNGQVWRQAEQSGVPLILADDGHYPIEIARSGLGGYRMVFTQLRREIVVKRIQ